MGRAFLEYWDGDRKIVVRLDRAQLTIGRAPENQVVLIDQPTVSRHHAVLKMSGSGWLVEDLGSRNGTDLNGHRIARPERLKSGDDIQVGPVRFHFLDPSAGTQPTLDSPAGQAITRTTEPGPGGLHTAELTPRELEIVALVAGGRTDQDIANALYISVKTVRSHLDRIREKTGLRRRAQLTRFYLSRADRPFQTQIDSRTKERR